MASLRCRLTLISAESFDVLLVDHILNEFKAEYGIDLNGDRMAIQHIREAAEKAKIKVSSASQTEIDLPSSRTRRWPTITTDAEKKD